MLKSYAFDVDSNLVFTDTTILMEKKNPEGIREPIEITQRQFDEFFPDKEHYRFANQDKEFSMKNFRSIGGFKRDIMDAIVAKKFWPSRKKFIEANKNASPIAIITARGQSIEEIRDTHRKIIYDEFRSHQREDLVTSMRENMADYDKSDEEIIESYLMNNFYCPCSNQPFLESIDKKITDELRDRKNVAFSHFVMHAKATFKNYYGAEFLNHRKIRMGFSDDSHQNIQGLLDFINDKENGLRTKHPDVNFMLYDTFDFDYPIKHT